MNTIQDITNPDCWVEHDMSAELEAEQVKYDREHKDQIEVSVVQESDPEPTHYCSRCGVGGAEHDPATDGFDCVKILEEAREREDEARAEYELDCFLREAEENLREYEAGLAEMQESDYYD